MPSIKRIRLLPDNEITELYARPEFNHDERALYFLMTEPEIDALSHYSNTKTRIYFILQLGYFKAKQQFFKFDLDETQADVKYILSRFLKGTATIPPGRISRDYLSQQKSDILNLFGYKDWLSNYTSQIELRLCEILRYHPNKHSAMRQLLSYFDNQQIIIPSYRKLQDMFTAAFALEKKRLKTIISSIPEDIQRQLSDLIEMDDGISQLNIIRSDQKDFQYTAVKAEVRKHSTSLTYMSFLNPLSQRLSYQKMRPAIMQIC